MESREKRTLGASYFGSHPESYRVLNREFNNKIAKHAEPMQSLILYFFYIDSCL